MKKLFKFYVLAVLLGVPGLLVAVDGEQGEGQGELSFSGSDYESEASDFEEYEGEGVEFASESSDLALEELFDAIDADNLVRVQWLLEGNPSLITASSSSIGLTALHVAAEMGRADIARLLIEKGADVRARDDEGDSALYLAVEEGHEDVVQLLLDQNVDMTKMLHLAAQEGHPKVAELLIQKGADVNASPQGAGAAPLYFAALKGHAAVVKLLIERGADVNAVAAATSKTALYAAAGMGHLEVVRLLLENGANVNVLDPLSGRTPLFAAVDKGAMKVVQLLLSYGADINVKDRSEATLLDLASTRPHLAEVFEEFKKYNRMLWNAVCRSNAEVANLALVKGAYPNAIATEEMISKLPDTPAAVVECVRAAAERGDTPMHIAVEKEDARMVTLLGEFGGDIHIQNKAGDTAIGLASYHPSILAIILELTRRMRENQGML